MTQPLVVDDLAAGYPGRPVFADWRGAFAPGLTWLRGANGCGKSTLLKVLAGALPMQAGSLRLGALDASADPLGWRRALVWCASEPPAFNHLSPDEYAGFLAGLYPYYDLARYAEAAQALGLAPWRGVRLAALSTGSQRKAMLAACVAAGTRVLLLDEPLASLDAASVGVVQGWLAAAATQADAIWVVTSHEPLGAAEDAAQQMVLA